MLEKNGLIAKLDLWVFREVCRLLARWDREGREIVPVAVNLSRVHLQNEDSLTNFLNRKQFDAEMAQALEKQEKGTLFIIDLDGFKQVNDTFGHLMGDEVLKNSSQRIRLSFRKDDILSRYGGDEFIIYAPRLVDRGIIEQRLQVLQGLLRHSHALEGMTCAVTASIGIARFPADGVDRKTLFVNADSALYEAKRRGKDQYVFFSDLKKGR